MNRKYCVVFFNPQEKYVESWDIEKDNIEDLTKAAVANGCYVTHYGVGSISFEEWVTITDGWKVGDEPDFDFDMVEVGVEAPPQRYITMY